MTKFVRDGHTIEEWIDLVTADANKFMKVSDYKPVAIRVYLVSEEIGGSSATLISDQKAFDEYFEVDEVSGG